MHLGPLRTLSFSSHFSLSISNRGARALARRWRLSPPGYKLIRFVCGGVSLSLSFETAEKDIYVYVRGSALVPLHFEVSAAVCLRVSIYPRRRRRGGGHARARAPFLFASVGKYLRDAAAAACSSFWTKIGAVPGSVRYSTCERGKWGVAGFSSYFSRFADDPMHVAVVCNIVSMPDARVWVISWPSGTLNRKSGSAVACSDGLF